MTTNSQTMVEQVMPAIPAVVEVRPPQQGGELSQPPLVIPEQDAPLVMDFVTEAMEHIESSEAGLLELENKPGNTEVLNKIFRGFHTIKGMAGFLNLTEIQTIAHAAENILDMARKGMLVVTGPISDIVLEVIDAKKKIMATLKECVQASKPVPAYPGTGQLLEKLKLAAEGKLAQSQPKIAQTVIEQKETTESHDKENIKVSTTRLDKLINTVGELVIAQLMVAEETDENHLADELVRKVSHQSKIVRELQELSMVMRMVPIQGVFQKMTRLVRDLSHKTGKPIDFFTSGEETELDRNIVDKITDPLIHMIRNAVDHGIELPEARSKAGKNPTARVDLRAYHKAGNIVIEIQDDGKGLDKERILKKAVEAGLAQAGQQLDTDEIFRFIFRAGITTAEKVTDVSGRGVGMDVVKRNIESLRGKIDISSTPGKGSTFTIRLPLTLAIIDGQIVRIGNERYIIPIGSIVHSFRPVKEQIRSIQQKAEVAMVGGVLVPVVRLYEHFKVKPQSENILDCLLVMVEADGQKCCLMVDDLVGQQQVVIKSLGEGLGKINGVSGGAIMGDGRVSLILDVPGLIELGRQRAG